MQALSRLSGTAHWRPILPVPVAFLHLLMERASGRQGEAVMPGLGCCVSPGYPPGILVPMDAIWLEVTAFLSPDLGGNNNLLCGKEPLEALCSTLPKDSLSDELI